MAKRFKLRISKAVSSSFHSCRSKDPSTLPQDPVPSFFPSSSLKNPNTQLLTVDHFPIITPPPSSKPHHNSSFKHHVSAALLTAGCQCSSRNGEAYTSDGSAIRSPSQDQFKWKKEDDKWRQDTEQQPRRKISYSSVSDDDSDNDEVVAFPSITEKNKRRSNRKKKISTNKTRFLMMMNTTSSADERTGISFSSEKANWDDDIDINEEEDYDDETETLISSCKSCVEFSDDSSSDFVNNQELETIYETTTTRRKKKIGTSKRRVLKNTKSSVSRGMNNVGRSSISTTSSGSELPPRLSEFKKLIPSSVDGKVKESFAIVKKSEDPYEDFKRSMMEMILEKQMFEKNDLEQLLECFLSLNAKDYHGMIVEAFSEIWKTLFSPNHN
ncbi:hypothetical protein K7X08_032863 [Anisodus acutangulus]|uniref:Transcription repressor n=1 Tax=Anisodus acutangulus TaxID=402998 RepID=A0A9Q1M362_9SOLA|nr:hypothetical protein K7X08_032863 [Anisodus acutangulus]